MKVKYLNIIIGLAAAALSWSCNPDALQDLTPEDSQVFITNYEKNTNFGNYATFSMADSVYVVQNGRSGVSTLGLDYNVLRRVATNMTNRGYTRVGKEAKPDFGVNVLRISETQTGVVANINPWNNYWGFGGGFYYPPIYSYYQTTERYWSIEIIDLKNAGTSDRATVVWNAQIRGNGIFDDITVGSVIDAVFTQSAYLKKN
ncbi:DUF4136 domain-containing protein [Runella slithyformis]|uniref:DUF4136 domain-containing protein n=1 Tax=Runella slithyformis (strain ATCC 29530 / DSM 19594 / LMG 11500 / NCIMB 11436 / LSU 4) TaxID=761193 RepID=A0A7U3ZMH1_RUNSL|nr:DUF4136 domain-containing protein [Runella slithyformis]AEI49940.1 hypothetical protein Runsl_3579 [Runella slithyformis DSM 19594]